MANGDNRFSPFDVLERLKETGFEQDQAESLARILSDVEFRNMATRQDVEASTLALKQDIKELEIGFKRDMKELDYKIENVRAELKRDIKELAGSGGIKNW